jgi:hypothetical protein
MEEARRIAGDEADRVMKFKIAFALREKEKESEKELALLAMYMNNRIEYFKSRVSIVMQRSLALWSLF